MSRLGNILNKLSTRACIEKGTSGVWTYWKYSDGTFEAERYSTSGATGTMTQSTGVSGLWYSVITFIDFPSIGQTSVRSCNVTVSPPNNFIMDGFINRLTTSGVYFAYIRWGSGQAVSGITWTMRITGTWS